MTILEKQWRMIIDISKESGILIKAFSSKEQEILFVNIDGECVRYEFDKEHQKIVLKKGW